MTHRAPATPGLPLSSANRRVTDLAEGSSGTSWRKPHRRPNPNSLDPGGRFTEGMHGRIARRDVEPTRVHLGNVGEERRGGEAILSDERSQIAKEDCVAEMGQRVVAHGKTCSRGGSQRLPGARPGLMGAPLLYHERFRRPNGPAGCAWEGSAILKTPRSRSGVPGPPSGLSALLRARMPCARAVIPRSRQENSYGRRVFLLLPRGRANRANRASARNRAAGPATAAARVNTHPNQDTLVRRSVARSAQCPHRVRHSEPRPVINRRRGAPCQSPREREPRPRHERGDEKALE